MPYRYACGANCSLHDHHQSTNAEVAVGIPDDSRSEHLTCGLLDNVQTQTSSARDEVCFWCDQAPSSHSVPLSYSFYSVPLFLIIMSFEHNVVSRSKKYRITSRSKPYYESAEEIGLIERVSLMKLIQLLKFGKY